MMLTSVHFPVRRVLGAVVIVAGLYLVVWGKSKDYKSSQKPIDEQLALPVVLMEEGGGKRRKEFDHEAIMIHTIDKGKPIADEKLPDEEKDSMVD